jgi:hypothetical protein
MRFESPFDIIIFPMLPKAIKIWFIELVFFESQRFLLADIDSWYRYKILNGS